MIVSDSEKFVFVHNPKCGGMSWHRTLEPYDTRDNFYFEWRTLPGGRTLDMAHITPGQMKRYFPDDFERVAGYTKFVFVRNPYTRFLSAVSQYLKLGPKEKRAALLADRDAFYAFAANVALYRLFPGPVARDHRLVHFRPQVDFAEVDGARWVDHVFHLEARDEIAGTPVAKWITDPERTNNPTRAFRDSGYEVERLGTRAIAALNGFYLRDFESFGYPRVGHTPSHPAAARLPRRLISVVARKRLWL